MPRSWTPNDNSLKTATVQQLHDTSEPALRSLCPNSGAYMNEGDPTSPTWKADFYGINYPALLAIKRKWDPNGVLWCKVCVGSDEDWEVIDGPADQDPVELAMGQVPGRVCRKN